MNSIQCLKKVVTDLSNQTENVFDTREQILSYLNENYDEGVCENVAQKELSNLVLNTLLAARKLSIDFTGNWPTKLAVAVLDSQKIPAEIRRWVVTHFKEIVDQTYEEIFELEAISEDENLKEETAGLLPLQENNFRSGGIGKVIENSLNDAANRAVFRLIVEKRLKENSTWESIARTLNQMGYRTRRGNEFFRSSVKNLYERFIKYYDTENACFQEGDYKIGKMDSVFRLKVMENGNVKILMKLN